MEQKLITIKTESELEQLLEYIDSREYLAFDTETTGLNKDDEIIGYSIAGDETTAFYVVNRYWDKDQLKLIDTPVAKHAKDVITKLIGKNLIMHNGVFDCYMVANNYQIELIQSLHTDTMILAHLLDENRPVGLKDLSVVFFDESAKTEQQEMKDSVTRNGGVLTKDKFELYKADADLIARYGAKDAILTLRVFNVLIEDLFAQELQDFFYKDESMPLLRGPTYELNTTGLKVDIDKLQQLSASLQAEILEALAFVNCEVAPYIKEAYPGTSKAKTFNINSTQQLGWLLFERLKEEFTSLTDSGRELCDRLGFRLPYGCYNKRNFIAQVKELKDTVYVPGHTDNKTQREIKPKVVQDFWKYTTCGKDTLARLSTKYKWVASYAECKKNQKLLKTYVQGVQERIQYGVIRPSFLQHGTTSGRYSCKSPNFQNLPRDDKRVKSCIISRPGKVFVGADYSQLEPRVFASFSRDKRLLDCFTTGDDFYSVIGREVFEKYDSSLKKDAHDSFAKKYPKLRDISKVVALSSTYGTTAPKMAPTIGKSMDEAQQIIDNYFRKFPDVKILMEASHDLAKKHGCVYNLFGRPRRMPAALSLPKNKKHKDMNYEQRNILNLAMNHRVQSTGASIMNRAAIACWKALQAKKSVDPIWSQVKIVLQVHDELILEAPEAIAGEVSIILKDAMENTVQLPGVKLLAEPKIAKDLASLK